MERPVDSPCYRYGAVVLKSELELTQILIFGGAEEHDDDCDASILFTADMKNHEEGSTLESMGTLIEPDSFEQASQVLKFGEPPAGHTHAKVPPNTCLVYGGYGWHVLDLET